jgi:predicted transcriptional regulator
MTILALQPAEITGLAQYREALGLSQRQASQITGVSRRHLARLEVDPALTPASIRIGLIYLALSVLLDGPPLRNGSNGRVAA